MIQTQAEREEKLAETIYEMNKSFYCELCDKQYFKYSEYDNHLNSYDHHHRQVSMLYLAPCLVARMYCGVCVCVCVCVTASARPEAVGVRKEVWRSSNC